MLSENAFKKLSEIAIGVKVKIHSFEKDEIILKLMEMGCLPGEIISIEKKAPFGDPISIIVSGYHLSLRRNEAEKIIVEEL
jgi:ferrous iron transport protein A